VAQAAIKRSRLTAELIYKTFMQKYVTEVCFVKKRQSYRSDGERKLGEKPVIPDLSEKCLLNWYVCVLFNS